MVFLFLFIISNNKSPQNNPSNIVVEYSTIKNDLYYELFNEFRHDLNTWNAHLDPQTLTLSFNEPDILFKKGQDRIKPLFKDILNDFFPRYIKILSNKKFKDNILEVRIEGHTSSEWNKSSTNKDAYILNMDLSQKRTSAVLKYILSMNKIKDYVWMRNHLISVGYSSSKTRYSLLGIEDKAASRRVEFRVVTDAESKLYDLINMANFSNINKEENNIQSN